MPHLRKLAVGYETGLSADEREMSLKRSLWPKRQQRAQIVLPNTTINLRMAG